MNQRKRTASSDLAIARTLLRNSRYRSKRDGIRHTITLADVVVPTHCPVLGVRLKTSSGRASPNSPSLDRIDSSRGYEPGNVVVVSWRANEVKKDASLEELERICSFYQHIADRKT